LKLIDRFILLSALATFIGEIVGLTLTDRWDIAPIATIVAVVIVLLYWLAASLSLKPFLRVIEQTQEIARGSRVALGVGNQSPEQERLTASIEDILAQMRASQTAMGTFLADASHELKTPLTVIKGYIELLTDRLNNKKQLDADFTAKALAKMSQEANRMQSLINELLLIAKVGETKTRTMTKLNLSEIVLNELQSIADLQPERQVITNVEPVVEITGDRALMEQLVANIFSNIRRHTAASATVRVSLLGGNTWAVFSVNDAGPGLSDEAYAVGISHFKRFDKSRSRATGGTGLGMSIIQSIVERHGGRMKLSKSDLGGLRTRIWLPR
jgi:two-component system, OmpR family, sensor kinase